MSKVLIINPFTGETEEVPVSAITVCEPESFSEEPHTMLFTEKAEESPVCRACGRPVGAGLCAHCRVALELEFSRNVLGDAHEPVEDIPKPGRWWYDDVTV